MSEGRRSTPASDAEGTLRVSEVMGILPPLAELRPFTDLLVRRSVADPGRRWSGSGELGTVGDRLVEPAEIRASTPEIEAAAARRLARLFAGATRIVEAAAAEEWGAVFGALIERGADAEEMDDASAAEAWYLSAHRLARERGLVEAPRALRLAARAARQMGRLGAAAERYEAAWRDAGAVGLEDDQIIAAIGRGNVEIDRGGWEEARRWYGRALERIGEEGAPRAERWQVLQNLAIVERESGNLEAARTALARAEEEGRDMADPEAAVKVGNGWGQLRLAEGRPREAELFFREALAAARTPLSRVAVSVNLGEALLLQGRTLEAGESARRAEAEAISGSCTQRLPEVYRLLARAQHQRGEGDAFVLLERALDLVRERGLPDYEAALTLEALGELRLAEGEAGLGVAAFETAADLYERAGAARAAGRLRGLIEARGPGDGGADGPPAMGGAS